MSEIANIFAYLTLRHQHGNGWNRGGDAFRIVVGQAILENPLALLAGGILLLRRLDRPDNDVRAAQLLDLFLCLIAGALANGQHRDDRTDAEDHA